jgi:hypothetical protein
VALDIRASVQAGQHKTWPQSHVIRVTRKSIVDRAILCTRPKDGTDNHLQHISKIFTMKCSRSMKCSPAVWKS